jgi:4-aminobutyrate aminotransferase/(S)-3-amino-2-methylpropionate transaminase
MDEEHVAERAAALGARIKRRFCAWADSDAGIGDVRGLGAMVAMEFVQDRTTKSPDNTRVGRIAAAALSRGLVLLSAGTYGNVIRVLVPLTAPDAVIDEGLDVMAEALSASRLAPH